MKYVALLRGINVGGKNRVETKKLKGVFESLGFTNVSTYLNSGNVIFEPAKKPSQKIIEESVAKEFGFSVPLLIKSEKEIKSINAAIPDAWKKDDQWQCNVAFLFPEIDSAKTINELPIKKEFVDIRYTKGAIFWWVELENYNKSNLYKVISHKAFKQMTIRNINTTRFLGNI